MKGGAMSEDILERAKKALIDDDMTYEDYDECISLLIAEVERLRSENNRINKLREAEINQAGAAERVYLEAMMVKDARIKELESEITAWVADRDSWIARYDAVRKEKDAEVEAKNDKIAQDAITIQMHHENVLVLQKEVERLRSPEISGDLKKKTLMLMEEIAKRKFPMMKCECTCEDFRFRGVPCKHMMAVEIAKHNGDLNAD